MIPVVDIWTRQQGVGMLFSVQIVIEVCCLQTTLLVLKYFSIDNDELKKSLFIFQFYNIHIAITMAGIVKNLRIA